MRPAAPSWARWRSPPGVHEVAVLPPLHGSCAKARLQAVRPGLPSDPGEAHEPP